MAITTDRPWALVTGASEGLGKEFARQIAKRQTHNVILAARSEAKLTALAAELVKEGVQCKIFVIDLSKAEAAAELQKRTESLPVSLLVNNAGVAYGGPFEDMHLEDIQQLLKINVVAFTELLYLFLPRVKEQFKLLHEHQKKSKHALAGIINLSSTAAFTPIPSMAAYAATKAYVQSLTEAIYTEQRLESNKIPIMACCPGPTKTEIWTKGGAHDQGLMLPMLTSEQCVQITLRAFDKNRMSIITGWVNNLLSFGGSRLTPRALLPYISHRVMGQDPSLRDPDEVQKTYERMGRQVPSRSKV